MTGGAAGVWIGAAEAPILAASETGAACGPTAGGRMRSRRGVSATATGGAILGFGRGTDRFARAGSLTGRGGSTFSVFTFSVCAFSVRAFSGAAGGVSSRCSGFVSGSGKAEGLASEAG